MIRVMNVPTNIVELNLIRIQFFYLCKDVDHKSMHKESYFSIKRRVI
jgi:hypothetical protein